MEVDRNIIDLNMEIYFFINKMEYFQKNINKIDGNLSNSLISILHTIQNFIDNSEIVQTTTDTSFSLKNDEYIQMHRSFYCTACNSNIGAKKDKLVEHSVLANHKNSVWREYAKKKSVTNVYPMSDSRTPSNILIPTPIQKLSPENLDLMKMQQAHQQQLQQRHQLYLQEQLARQNVIPMQQENGFVAPFTQNAPMRPFVSVRDVPGMKEVRTVSSPTPLMSLNFNDRRSEKSFQNDRGNRCSSSSSLSGRSNLASSSRASRRSSPRRSVRSDRSESSNSGRYVQAKPVKSSLSNNTMKQTRRFFEQDIVAETNKLVESGRRAISSLQYQNIVNDLETKLKITWPNVKAHCFGSRVNGLACFGGDLDIFIDVGNKYNEGKLTDMDFLVDCVEKTEKVLNVKNSDWKGFEAVKLARIPILRALNNKEGIDCDLSFTNGLSHCNTELMKYFMDLQPVCIKLCVFIKHWSKNFQFRTPSYGFVLKVIFYLQEKKVLPSVRELQTGAEEYLIGPWKANFCDKSLRELNIPKNDDFIQHLIGFFDYYAEFDYKESVICPYLGYKVSKSTFDIEKKNFQPELKLYNDYIETLDLEVVDTRHILLDIEAPLCTQDPFELCHNVTRNFKVSSLQKFVDLCKLSKSILADRKF